MVYAVMPNFLPHGKVAVLVSTAPPEPPLAGVTCVRDLSLISSSISDLHKDNEQSATSSNYPPPHLCTHIQFKYTKFTTALLVSVGGNWKHYSLKNINKTLQGSLTNSVFLSGWAFPWVPGSGYYSVWPASRAHLRTPAFSSGSFLLIPENIM